MPQRLGQSALQFESKTPPLEFFLLDTLKNKTTLDCLLIGVKHAHDNAKITFDI